MNRFDSTKPKVFNRIVSWLPLIFVIVLLIFFIVGVNSVSATTADKQLESLQSAVSRSISECYAVEGAYPESLDYLCEHYGLVIDYDNFFVDYDYYGGNLYPDYAVLRRSGQ